MIGEVSVIGFDADDTLWVNENYYRDTETQYVKLLAAFGNEKEIMEALYRTEMQNLPLFGYGIKSFVISMMENAIALSGGKVPVEVQKKIISMGKEMIRKPIRLLPGVREVLEKLGKRYKLIVATKGDLLDQERKLERSSLSGFFHHIEIMSDKTRDNYRKLLRNLDVDPARFVMIGNSVRSDILPPLELGCYAIHVPYMTTWQHEMEIDHLPEGDRYFQAEHIDEVLGYLL